MKKIFIIHGFEAKPNGAWRPWLMGELGRKDIWACALAMPEPAEPLAHAWVEEIARHVETSRVDDVYLVGHSLGVPAILRYLQSAPKSVRVAGALLVAGPFENIGKPRIQNFFDEPFDFDRIRSRCEKFRVIHAKDDANVPFEHAGRLAEALGTEVIALPTGAHLNGQSGTYALPEALTALETMMH